MSDAAQNGPIILNRREFGVLRDMSDYVSNPMFGRRNDGIAVFPRNQPLFIETNVDHGLLEHVGSERGGVDVYRVTTKGHALVAEWRAGRWLPAVVTVDGGLVVPRGMTACALREKEQE